MAFVRHCCGTITDPHCCVSPAEGRDLAPPERAAYHAALEVLRLYFSGEIEFHPGASAEDAGTSEASEPGASARGPGHT